MSREGDRQVGRSLRADLESDRFGWRRRRLEMVLSVLREREAERERRGEPVPPPLRAAIQGFGRELGGLRRERPPSQTPLRGAG
jgi:hypothetical protein